MALENLLLTSLQTPPPRAIGRNQGRTFEFTIPLPEPSNAGGRPPSRAKQAGKKTRTLPTQGRTALKAKQAKPRTAPTPAPPEAGPLKQLEPERKKTSTPDHREYHRLRAREERRRAKEQCLCRDCGEPAIPDQTRCSTCAEKHRLSRRRWQAERRKKSKRPAPSTEKL